MANCLNAIETDIPIEEPNKISINDFKHITDSVDSNTSASTGKS